MEKIYNPCNIEQSLYNDWEKQGYFKPKHDKNKESFCIMMPPPNVTGSLHIGHAFQQIIMDAIVRYYRMQGKNVLWQVGMDHAGIATQMIVERKISIEEGKTRHDYGRYAFINKIWKWTEQSSKIITHQMRRLGNSVDWRHNRFTMDENFSNAVKEAFVSLYKEGLIYRCKCLINWDPKLCTAISDLEIENRESKGFIWNIRYPLTDGVKTIDGKNYLTVSTTRPETLLGDTGVAVNPKDSRYKNLIGKSVIVPLINRKIPIIEDKYIDMKKGTGCVKITPAHDFKDYEIGHRHALPMINILTLSGNIRDSAQIFDTRGNESNIYSKEIPVQFCGLDRFVARKAVISAIDALGLLESVNLYDLILPYGDRSGVIIEPMLNDQWFLRASMLSQQAIDAVKKGDIQFIPKKYKKMYFSWMYNIKDWCISRQLWWGHRIPAWYDDQGNVYVGRNKEEVYKENNLNIKVNLRQDDDVLDTWFSSSLWTFSSLGWPEKTNFLYQFHPTNVVVSGFDIIFFWIARMIMMTMHFIKDEHGNPQVPFRTVYITGLVRDEEGQKMSKSKGNVIDPLDMIDGISLQDLINKRTGNMMRPQLANEICNRTKQQFQNGIQPYGTDALRFTLASLTSTGRDINWNMKKLENCRNFCNKLWNASRFILMNTEKQDCGFNNKQKIISSADRWIITEFNQTVKSYRESLERFRFDSAANILYEFIRNQFCDWYLELVKPVINSDNIMEIRGTRYTLVTVLEALLRLAHPIIPFITEIIWKRVKTIIGINADTIMLQPFPEYDISLIDKEALDDIEWIKKVIIFIRNIRAKMNISSNKLLRLLLRDCNDAIIRRVHNNYNILIKKAGLTKITILHLEDKNPPATAIKIIDGVQLIIPIITSNTTSIKLDQLEKEILKVEKEINRLKNKLENKDFVTYAPKSIISKEREKLLTYIKEKTKLVEQQAAINIDKLS